MNNIIPPSNGTIHIEPSQKVFGLTSLPKGILGRIFMEGKNINALLRLQKESQWDFKAKKAQKQTCDEKITTYLFADEPIHFFCTKDLKLVFNYFHQRSEVHRYVQMYLEYRNQPEIAWWNTKPSMAMALSQIGTFCEKQSVNKIITRKFLRQMPLKNPQAIMQKILRSDDLKAYKAVRKNPLFSSDNNREWSKNFPLGWLCGHGLSKDLKKIDFKRLAIFDLLCGFKAVLEKGDEKVFFDLLKISQVSPDFYGNYLIRQAACLGRTNLVRCLLRREVDPSSENSNALILAIRGGHIDVVDLLLKDGRANPTIEGYKPLMEAIRENQIEIAKRLIQDSRVKDSPFNLEPLEHAANKGFAEIVEALLPHVKLINSHIFTLACRGRNLRVIELLLNHERIDPTYNHHEAFHWACKKNHIEIVELLLKDGRIRPQRRRNRAIFDACQKGNVEVVSLLLKNPEVMRRLQPQALLNMACYHGHDKIVKLLRKNLNVDFSYDDSEALFQACHSNNRRLVRSILRDKKVQPAAQNNRALIAAAGQRSVRVVEVLLKDARGVDPAAEEDGPLIAACQANRTRILKRLLEEKKVNPSARENQAWKLAKERGYKEIISLLESDPRFWRPHP